MANNEYKWTDANGNEHIINSRMLTADELLELVRPQGEWKSEGGFVFCNQCGCSHGVHKTNFCSNCGADMRGDSHG